MVNYQSNYHRYTPTESQLKSWLRRRRPRSILLWCGVVLVSVSIVLVPTLLRSRNSVSWTKPKSRAWVGVSSSTPKKTPSNGIPDMGVEVDAKDDDYEEGDEETDASNSGKLGKPHQHNNNNHHNNNNNNNNNHRKNPLKIACIGDSITFRGCVTNRTKTYTAQLSRILGPGFEVTNYGKSGTTLLKEGLCCYTADEQEEEEGIGSNNATTTSSSSSSGDTCSYWKTPEFRAALESSPDIVTIMLGTHDAKRCNWYGPPNQKTDDNSNATTSTEEQLRFPKDYHHLIQKFRSLPSAPKVYLAIPPPLVSPPKHPDDPPPFDMDPQVINQKLVELVPAIASEASKGSSSNNNNNHNNGNNHNNNNNNNRNHVVGVVDAWSALGGTLGYNDPTRTCDGCHPKKGAHAIMARAFAAAISQDFPA